MPDMDWVRIFSNASTGIAVTIGSLLGTGIVLLLVFLAKRLYPTKYVDVTCRRFSFIDPHQVKLNVTIQSENAKAKEIIGLSLVAYDEKGQMTVLSTLDDMPLSSDYDTSFIVKKDSTYALRMPNTGVRNVILTYVIESRIDLSQFVSFALRGHDETLHILEAEFKNFYSTDPSSLRFKAKGKIRS